MPDFYNIGAAKGRIAGQGLMAMGQGVSGVMETQKREKVKAEEKAEKKKERQFTKTLSLVNLYTKMGDSLTPESRMKLYTGALIPMMAKAGGLPEGPKKDDVSQFIGSLAAHDKEAMQGFRDDNNKLLDLVNDGKWKEADKFLNGMMGEYGKLPGAKPFLDHAKTLLKDEKTYSRSEAGKAEARKNKATGEVQSGVLAGTLEEVPKGQEGAYKDRPVVKDYGGTGLTVAGRSEEQKIDSAANKAGAIAKAKEGPEGLSWKEKETFKTEEAIRKGKAIEKGKGPKEPSPVTWTTATKELKGRFGKQDPIGNIILTPELAGMHRIAQKKMVALKKDRKVGPLEAINMAEDFARNIESRYWEYINAAKADEQREKVKRTFKAKYNYIPRTPPR